MICVLVGHKNTTLFNTYVPLFHYPWYNGALFYSNPEAPMYSNLKGIKSNQIQVNKKRESVSGTEHCFQVKAKLHKYFWATLAIRYFQLRIR